MSNQEEDDERNICMLYANGKQQMQSAAGDGEREDLADIAVLIHVVMITHRRTYVA